MPWLAARLDERCGSCGRAIAETEAVYVFHPGGFARGARRVRCLACGTNTFGPPPADGLSADTTAPQPSFRETPLERLPNVVDEGFLQRRRQAAIARIERWRARQAHASGGRA